MAPSQEFLDLIEARKLFFACTHGGGHAFCGEVDTVWDCHVGHNPNDLDLFERYTLKDYVNQKFSGKNPKYLYFALWPEEKAEKAA